MILKLLQFNQEVAVMSIFLQLKSLIDSCSFFDHFIFSLFYFNSTVFCLK